MEAYTARGGHGDGGAHLSRGDAAHFPSAGRPDAWPAADGAGHVPANVPAVDESYEAEEPRERGRWPGAAGFLLSLGISLAFWGLLAWFLFGR